MRFYCVIFFWAAVLTASGQNHGATLVFCNRIAMRMDSLIASDVKTALQKKIQVSDTVKSGTFQWKFVKQKVELTFSPDYFATANYVSLNSFVKICAGCSLGVPPEKALKFRDSWIFAAVVFRSASQANSASMRSERLPAVYAMVANGIVPEIERILDFPVRPDDGFVLRMFCEWSEILFRSVHRNTVSDKNSVFENYIAYILKNPSVQESKAFSEKLYPVILQEWKRKRRHYKSYEPDMNEWFYGECIHFSLNLVNPYSACAAEIHFENLMRQSAFFMKENKKIPPEDIQNFVVLAVELRNLISVAPPQIINELSSCFNIVQKIISQKKCVKSDIEEINKCEQEIFRQLENLAAVENTLRYAELKYSMPALRIPFTLYTALEDENFDKPKIFERAGKLLEKY